MKTLAKRMILMALPAMLFACQPANDEQEKKIAESPQIEQTETDQDAWKKQIEEQSKEVLEGIAHKKYRILHKYAMNRFRYSGANPDRMNAFSDQQVNHVKSRYDGSISRVALDTLEGKWRARAVYHTRGSGCFAITWYHVTGEWRYYGLEHLDSLPG
jgi:hypothetical protein